MLEGPRKIGTHFLIDPLVATMIISGGLLSIMCVGLTVTYQTTKVPNFACADFAVVGMDAAYFSFVLLRLSSPYIAAPLSILAGGTFAVIMYLLIVKPMVKRGSTIIMLMIASLAVDIFFTGVQADISIIGYSAFRPAFSHAGITPLVSASPLPDFTILGEPGLIVVSPLVLMVATGAMYFLLTKTKFGIAMRASIENPNLARVVGVNVDRVYFVSWFIAGGLAGLGGCLYAIANGMSITTSSILILDIFAGSVVGGLSSIYGAVIGGMLVAFGEYYLIGVLSNTVSSQLALLEFGGVSMIILIVTLLVAPKGIVSVNWRKFVPGRRP
jgi:branched-chain amino acid transport system permease protein